MSLSAVVHQHVAHHKSNLKASDGSAVPVQGEPPHDHDVDGQRLAAETADGSARTEKSDLPPPRVAHFKSPPTTPSTRTGPPRSLSYTYSLPNSPVASRNNSRHENGDIMYDASQDGVEFPFSLANTDFRGALEYYGSADDRKGKKRESRTEESWNPMKWFHESPKEEKSGFEFEVENADNSKDATQQEDVPKEKIEKSPKALSTTQGEGESSSASPKTGLRRAFSVPHSNSENKAGRAKWTRLRSLIPNVITQGQNVSTPGPSAVTSNSVNITDELITGGLSTLMLRLWFERDEKGHRRIPLLFHRLRLRVSDSLHPMHGHKSVFRIECEYANGAARWVVYRELRDFVSLHTHYTVSNVYNRNVENMPEFPKTSTFFL